MRACLAGNQDLALKLYNRNPRIIEKTNSKGEDCLAIAKSAGFAQIATTLECLEAARKIESKGNSFLTIRPQNETFAKPLEILLNKKIRTKSLDEHRLTSTGSGSAAAAGQNRCRMKLRSCSPASSGSCSPLQQPLTISVESPRSSSSSVTRKYLFSKRASLDWASRFGAKSSRIRLKSGSLEDPYAENNNPGSPFVDVEALSDEDSNTQSEKLSSETEDQRVLSLAEQFLAAMPARIKHDHQDVYMRGDEFHHFGGDDCSCDASQSDDLGIESMTGDDFDLDDRYRDVYTPASSVSSVSSCLHSPRSMTYESPSPASFPNETTPADLQEFLQASIKCERDLSNLTLSDQEQRELYEAAQIIQKAYRSYKGRKKGQDREAKAAIVIQNYYRRYKQVCKFRIRI